MLACLAATAADQRENDAGESRIWFEESDRRMGEPAWLISKLLIGRRVVQHPNVIPGG